jgi:hypothetical protein
LLLTPERAGWFSGQKRIRVQKCGALALGGSGGLAAIAINRSGYRSPLLDRGCDLRKAQNP